MTSMAASPEGKWKALDDKTQKEVAEIELKIINQELQGTIVRLINAEDNVRCTKCPSEFKDKPLEGLPILWGLIKNKNNIWTGGHILDAKTGKIHHAKLTVKEDKIFIRDFNGLSMLGRTHVWIRADE